MAITEEIIDRVDREMEQERRRFLRDHPEGGIDVWTAHLRVELITKRARHAREPEDVAAAHLDAHLAGRDPVAGLEELAGALRLLEAAGLLEGAWIAGPGDQS